MKRITLATFGIQLATGVTLLIGSGGRAEAVCADLNPLRPFLVADRDTQRCQDAVGRAGRIYATGALKAMQACLERIQAGSLAGDPATVCRGTPPTDGPTAGAIAAAEQRAGDLIDLRCTDATVAGLDACADTVAGLKSCLVAAHGQTVQDLLDAEYGYVVASNDAGVRQCQRRIGRVARRLLTVSMRGSQHCYNRRNRTCQLGDPAARCVGEVEGGIDVPPSDTMVANRTNNAIQGLRARIGSTCSDAETAALDACASTALGLMECLECSHRAGAADLLGGEYGGTERFADPSTTLQAAVDEADPGDRVMLDPGTYSEEVTIGTPGLHLIGNLGCDGERPLIVNPDPGNTDNGIFACGSLDMSCTSPADGLTFERFDMGEFDDNGILTVGVNGVTFRDLVVTGTGTAASMEYAIFPVGSNDVLIEDCVASGISDAALYVGQSTNIVVRNNEVFGSVAGIEIENSANAEVYGNHAHDNAGGILVFKLPGLPVQLSQCHEIHDNLSENNNGPNFGSGTVGLVPSGTGMIFLSNDSSVIHDNTLTGNKTFGIAFTDQIILNLLFTPKPFPFPSPDAATMDNYFIDNVMTGNGFDPDPAGGGFGDDFLAVTVGGSGNCRSGNTYGTTTQSPALASTCPVPPDPPGCPFVTSTSTTVSTSTTTSVTGSTVTTTSTTSTTIVPFTWTQVQGIFVTNCASLSCHGTGGPSPAGLTGLEDYDAGYAAIVNVPATEPAWPMDRVEPFDSTQSYLMHKLDGTHLDILVGGTGQQMPFGGPPLPLGDRNGIRAWIDSGAPKN